MNEAHLRLDHQYIYVSSNTTNEPTCPYKFVILLNTPVSLTVCILSLVSANLFAQNPLLHQIASYPSRFSVKKRYVRDE
jgi:hypothetical protein